MTGKNEDSAHELQILLDLDSEIFPMENGFWTKFEIKEVNPTEQIPHGIKYSLTLHDRHNTRILGYDNAHALKPRKRRFSSKRIIWDHRHKRDITEPYEFDSPGQLLGDFWRDVETIIDAQ